MEETKTNKFKPLFKYYKRKNPPPCLDNVLDVKNISHESQFTKRSPEADIDLGGSVSMNPITSWSIFSSKPNPGLHLLTNVLDEAHQLAWARRCLENYSCAKYRRNIDLPGSVLPVSDWYQHALQTNEFVDKLRWSTLGYHHDWDSKQYDLNMLSSFPPDLSHLARAVAATLGYTHYNPQAAIVNYYTLSATLSSHTDHSEINTSQPIVSASLGQSAVFLIGGESLCEKPTAYLLRSGDIVVMEEGARLSYHAVPRIVKSFVTDGGNKEEQERMDRFCLQYLENHRININVRQVY